MGGTDAFLFCDKSLREVTQDRTSNVIREIDSLAEPYLLQINTEEFAASLVGKYWIEPIQLDTEAAEIVERGEVNVDVRNNHLWITKDKSKPHYVKGLRVTLAIPFTGNPTILKCVPETYAGSSPLGRVVGSEIRISIDGVNPEPNLVKVQFDENINLIQQYLGWGREQVNGFNQSLPGLIQDRINQRKQNFAREHKLVEAIGFRVRSRENSPQTYTVPVQRKRVPIAKSSPVGKADPGEPFLDQAAYESILETVASMTRVIELNPKAFATMHEEELRYVLLIPLNIQYEGQATGETFNLGGKTDIIIKVGGKNIFIAECLIWDGPQYFSRKIDQILEYVSWRDTKTAIIVFNRNKEMSRLLAQIPGLVGAHPNHIRSVSSYQNETGFRFILHHRDDPKRELTLTVLIFDVPG